MDGFLSDAVEVVTRAPRPTRHLAIIGSGGARDALVPFRLDSIKRRMLAGRGYQMLKVREF